MLSKSFAYVLSMKKRFIQRQISVFIHQLHMFPMKTHTNAYLRTIPIPTQIIHTQIYLSKFKTI